MSDKLADQVRNKIKMKITKDDGKLMGEFISPLESLTVETVNVPQHFPDLPDVSIFGITARELSSIVIMLQAWVVMQLEQKSHFEDGDQVTQLDSQSLAHVYEFTEASPGRMYAKYTGTEVEQEIEPANIAEG